MAELNNATVAAQATNLEWTSAEHYEKGSDICLKCGNATHIPYKYKGQTFHARCLICNHCGKKLVGKPFITDRNQIYCGDQCKQDFERNPCTVSVLVNDSQVSEGNNDSGPLNESLLDALESIKESKQDIMRLTRQTSPMNSLPDPDRITDYPRRPSPSVSLLSLSSRRSSLSAMSQSSLTSDSSFDASRKPGKKILKNPHRPARSSKNRVTWKLPNTGDGAGIDSDTMSIDSLESSSSSIYNRARSGVWAARQTWRDFENSPPRGSTGITPIKPIQRLPLTRSSSATGTLQMYSPPSNLATIPQGTVISDLESKSSDNLMRPRLTSPLTYNTSSNNSSSSGSVLHSTPIRQTPIKHTQSASNLEFQTKMQQFRSSPDQVADVDIPILRLDNSNLTDLEESTLEDRKRMHIFQFPQNNQQAILQTPDKSRSKQPAALLEDDDASDYDHLSPLQENKSDQNKQKGKDVSVRYSARDIGHAPEITAKQSSGVGHGRGGNGSQKIPPSEEVPPSIPPKRSRQERKAAIGLEATRILSKPVSVSRSQRQSSGIRHNAALLPQTPPPVPPKMRKKKQQNNIFPTSGNTKEDTYQSDEILPPPPEFSKGSQQPGRTNTTPPQSYGSAEEDLTSSVSNTTLVEEEHTKPKSSRSHTTPSPTTMHQLPIQHTDTKQSWTEQGIWDRIVEGAEDPGPPVDKQMFKESANQLQSPTLNFDQIPQRRQHYFHGTTTYPESHSQPNIMPMDFKTTPHYSQQAHIQEATKVPNETLTSPTSSRYKISLETAFAEGNIMKGVPMKHPVTTHQPSERSAVERNQPANRPHKSIPRSNSVGQNSQPAASIDVHLSQEEQEVRRRFYSGGKLPMEKPVVHVKNQSVTQLLKELEINDKKHAANVTCKVCKKTIQGSSYTMNGESYHSRCYKCAVCGSVLRGKKAFTVNNKLFCRDCHARQERSLGQAVDSTSQQQIQYRKPPRDYQVPQAAAAGRHNMTSV